MARISPFEFPPSVNPSLERSPLCVAADSSGEPDA